MLNINFKVTESSVEIMEKSEILPSGNLKKIKCIFDLDTAYDDLIVRAVFNGRFVTVENGECFAPLLNSGMCVVGVYGYAVNNNGEFETILSPKPTSTYISLGSYNENDAEGDNPTPTELEEHYNRVKELVDSGKLKGDPGEKGDKGDKGDTGATGATGPQGPPGKDAVTDTEMSTESDNAIANSTVSKVLAYGNLIGFEKIDSLEEFGELNDKYPEGIPEDDFLVLYITADLSYADMNGSFDCPPGLYVITADNFFRLCPDAESVNSQFKAVDEAMRTWVGLVGMKANQIDLDRVKEDLGTVVEDLNTVSETADEALREISVSNGDIANYLEVADILGIWKNATAGRTSFANLFENSAVKVVPLLDTSDGTNFSSMFKGCGQLESVPLFDTSKATTFLNMFYGCESLKSIPAFNTAKLTNSFGMVRECVSLTSFKGIDTSKVTNMNGMFYGCALLEEVEVDTSSVSAGNYVFYRCESLRSVKTLDFSNITSLSGQFYQCFNLESVEFVPESIRVSMSVSDCSKLNSDSVASIFEGLADLTDSETQTLTLHKNIQITQAQADAAVAKNWNIVGGTVNG